MAKAVAMAGIVLAAALFLCGCGVQPGKPLATYQREHHSPPPMVPVSQQGLYALFPGDGIAPLVDPVYLNRGDKFGFATHEGKVVGSYVRGIDTHNIPLDGVLTTEYVWKYQGDKKP